MAGELTTAEAALFEDRALRGHITVTRDEFNGERQLVFTKHVMDGTKIVRRFRLEGNTLSEADDG